MKITKYVDVEHGVDNYLVTIEHSEAEVAFKKMSEAEREMIADMQYSSDVMTILRLLMLWVQKIEESKW